MNVEHGDDRQVTRIHTSLTPIPRACFSLGNFSWNFPIDAVDAFATVAAVRS